MSFFDDVINTTKNAAQTAGKKTDEAVRFTKPVSYTHLTLPTKRIV